MCQDRTIASEHSVVLVSTRNPLNIGAAARALANFGLNDLRLVNPYMHAFREAVSAVGAEHLMQAARVFTSVAEAVSDCSLVVGLTAAQNRELQQPIAPLATGISQIHENSGRTALMFGSEKTGLSNDDMSYCHLLVRIPTSPETPSMNLGQAVAVCLYELTRAGNPPPPRGSRFEPIEGNDAEQVTRMLHEVLEKSGYTERFTAVSTEQKIRRWVRRTRLSRRDAPLLLGILRQVLWKIDQ
jgi:tRNA/rRNA methyltransferase